MERGQVSTEYLILLAATLSTFVVIASASIGVGDTAINGMNTINTFISVRHLVDVVNTVCILPSGSSVEVEVLFLQPVTLEQVSDYILANTTYGKKIFATKCSVSVPKIMEGKYRLKLVNEYGNVVVSIINHK